MLWRGLLHKHLRSPPQHSLSQVLLIQACTQLGIPGPEDQSGCTALGWPPHVHHLEHARPYSTDGRSAARAQQQKPGQGGSGAITSRLQQQQQQQQQLQQQDRRAQFAPKQAPQGASAQQRPGFMALRSMQGTGSASSPMSDLARENAPTKILELIGDPRRWGMWGCDQR